jgi:hypothetical protein
MSYVIILLPAKDSLIYCIKHGKAFQPEAHNGMLAVTATLLTVLCSESFFLQAGLEG